MKAKEYIYQRFKDEYEFKLISDLYKIMEDFAEQEAIEFLKWDAKKEDTPENIRLWNNGDFKGLYNKFKKDES